MNRLDEGQWRMVTRGRVWHWFVRGVALCGVVDDGVGVGRVNARDCPVCELRLRLDSVPAHD